MRKKIIAGLLIVALITISVTFGYMVNQVKTDTFNISIGGVGDEATLTYTGRDGVSLVPYNTREYGSNEVIELKFTLIVESEQQRSYTIEDNLPDWLEIQSNVLGSYYNTGTTYSLSIRMLEQGEAGDYDFFLYINFV